VSATAAASARPRDSARDKDVFKVEPS